MWYHRKWLAALATAVLTVAAAETVHAASMDRQAVAQAEEMRGDVVGTMVLTGRLVVAADGAISAYAIDRSDKVPPQVLRHVASYVPHWRVKVADGIPGDKRFSVRVMAVPRGEGNYALALVGASITEARHPERDITRNGRVRRPEYPRTHAAVGISGTVYMLAKVGRDGRVQDLAAEQVDLDFVGAPVEVAQVRADFAAQTAAALRQWTFRTPTSGPLAVEPYFIVRVPVQYKMKRTNYGEWEYYVPGPRLAVPWAKQDGGVFGAGEANTLDLLGVGTRLETPLQP